MSRQINNLGFRQNPGDEQQYVYDAYAHAVTTITEPHRLSHDGMMFHASSKFTGLANGASQDLLIAVPATTFPHFQRFNLSVSAGDIDILVYEGTTASADGTVVPNYNTNRNSANTPDTVLTHTPTVTTPGTLVHTNWVPSQGSGVGNQSGIINVSNGEEWVLAPSTKYLLRITNGSGGSVDLRTEIVWYELGYEH